MNDKNFDTFVQEYLALPLKSIGFKKKGLTWNRNNNNFVQLINLQKARYSDSDTVTFTLNIGVFDSDIFNCIWDKQINFVNIENCIINTRIGSILENNFRGNVKDYWWDFETDSTNEEIKELFVKIIDLYIIPFLNRFSDLETVFSFLSDLKGADSKTPLHKIHLAIVACKLNRKDEAQQILSCLIRECPSWRDKCLLVAEKLKISVACNSPVGKSVPVWRSD